MIYRLLGRRDALDIGLTASAMTLMSITCSRMSEMGVESCIDICFRSLFYIYIIKYSSFKQALRVCACRWVLLEALEKISPGSVNWKQATKPPIKMPFRKVENCNQVVEIGKQLEFSLVNVAGNDFVQGNKKLILGTFLYAIKSVYLEECI